MSVRHYNSFGFLSFYLTAQDESADPMISLAKANLSNLPPTTIINTGIDSLRSEGELLAQKIREAGERVEQKIYKAVAHEFFGMDAADDNAGIGIDNVILSMADESADASEEGLRLR